MRGGDDRNSQGDIKFREVGTGHHSRWLCLGCGRPRSHLGSRGIGVRKRCAACLADRNAAKAQ